jgi:chemotaxis response regulator CheB/nitrogen-specific signal transduction histidine kinase
LVDRPHDARPTIVAIGASAGGLEAVTGLLGHLPADTGLAIVVVQHLDPTHESSLTELFGRACQLPVSEAAEGVVPEPDHVYVIPPNKGMILRDGALHLIPRDGSTEARRPIDLFFRSLAENDGARPVGIVLSGSGSDGTSGVEAIRAAGGITFAQDGTAAFGAMPTSAVASGCVDFVLPPASIGAELVRLARHPARPESGSTVASPTYETIVGRMSEFSGVDFSRFKPPTINQGIQRRMAVARLSRPEDYLKLIERDAAEMEALCREALINVTSFFRDPAVFEALKRKVFPPRADRRPAGGPRPIARVPSPPKPPGGAADGAAASPGSARDATGEELRATIEELQTTNEELQTSNEELQTTQAELQATNEELQTVNDELERRNEEAMRLTDDLTNLLSSVRIPIVMLGPDLKIRRYTPDAEKMLNVIPSDVARSILDLRLNLEVPDLAALLAEVSETLETRQRDLQDLEGRWHTLWIGPYQTRDRRVDGTVIALRDIDAVKRSAERLAQALDYAQSIVMTVREPLLVLDRTLAVRLANDAVGETFQSVPGRLGPKGGGEAAGVSWDIPGLADKLETVWKGGLPFADYEVEAEFPEIGRRVVRASARRVHRGEEEEPLVLLAVEDVTDRRRAQAESAALVRKMQETQRLESLGVLAGGIAHDFNNILTTILGYSNVVREALPPASPLYPQVENIELGALRAADLCRQMLAYAGKGRYVVKRIDVSRLIDDLEPLLVASTSKKTVLSFDLDEGLPPVLADAAQLHQIVMNLVINASEAIGDRAGTIIVRTGRMRPDRAYLAAARVAPELPQEAYVTLDVTDDGEGMDAETLARVFEPFFSKKFVGRGLGLSAVLGIVRSHEGALVIDSEPGRGTTFRVLLPEAAPAEDDPAVGPPPEPGWRGKGTILVVDDESSVRGLLKQMLEGLGFRVVEAEHGRAGVEVYRAMADTIDVVMLDLTMPQMNGAETLLALRELRPDVRVILMTGYDERQTMDHLEGPAPAGFLHKPFRMAELSETLRLAIQ